MQAQRSPVAIARLGVSLVLAIMALLWGSTAVLVNVIPVGPMAVTTYQGVISALLLLTIVQFRGVRFRGGGLIVRGWRVWFGAMIFGATSLAFVLGVRLGTIGLFASFVQTAPLWGVVLERIILKKSAPKRTVYCAIASVVGGVLLMAGAERDLEKILPSVVFGLISAICYAWSGVFIVQEKLRAPETAKRMSLSVLIHSRLLLVLVGSIAAVNEFPRLVAMPNHAWGALVACGAIFAVASMLFTWGATKVSPTALMVIAMLEAPFSVVLAFIVFGQGLSVVQSVGTSIVFISVLVMRIGDGQPVAVQKDSE